MIQSVGGTSKIIPIKDCQHAFAAVYIDGSKENFDSISNSIGQYYTNKGRAIGNIVYYNDNQGYWLIVDPAGGAYLGDLFPSCRDKPLLAVC